MRKCNKTINDQRIVGVQFSESHLDYLYELGKTLKFPEREFVSRPAAVRYCVQEQIKRDARKKKVKVA